MNSYLKKLKRFHEKQIKDYQDQIVRHGATPALTNLLNYNLEQLRLTNNSLQGSLNL